MVDRGGEVCGVVVGVESVCVYRVEVCGVC